LLDFTLYEAIKEVQRMTGRNDPEWTERIESAIRRAYYAWESEFAWRDLIFEADLTFYGDDPYLVLPQDVEKVLWIVDADNYAEIEASDGQWDRTDTYALVTKYRGYAKQWQPVGIRPFATLVSTQTLTLEYVASVPFDTHIKQFQVRGYWQLSGATLANQVYEAFQQYEASGVTAAAAVFDLGAVLTNCLSINLVSALTCPAVFKDASGAQIGIVPPGCRTSQYYWVKLFYMPQNGTKFHYGAIRRLSPVTHFSLYSDTILPGADPEYLVWRAASDIFTEMGEEERAGLAMRRASGVLRRQREKEVMFGDHSSRIIPEDLT